MLSPYCVLDLTDEETATLLRELDTIIDADRYFLSPRIQTLREIRNMIRPEPWYWPPKFRFAHDSPLEGDGFDLSPEEKTEGLRRFRTSPIPRFVSRTVSDFCIPAEGGVLAVAQVYGYALRWSDRDAGRSWGERRGINLRYRQDHPL